MQALRAGAGSEHDHKVVSLSLGPSGLGRLSPHADSRHSSAALLALALPSPRAAWAHRVVRRKEKALGGEPPHGSALACPHGTSCQHHPLSRPAATLATAATGATALPPTRAPVAGAKEALNDGVLETLSGRRVPPMVRVVDGPTVAELPEPPGCLASPAALKGSPPLPLTSPSPGGSTA